MRIAVYSAKGGVGKTPIATNIVFDKEFALGTNERFHTFESIQAIDQDRLIVVPMEEAFPDFEKDAPDVEIVFDLAGSISKESHSIASAIKQSDLVIVPIENTPKSLNSGINTLLEVAQFDVSILVVATKLDKGKKEIFIDWKDSEDLKNVQAAVHKYVRTDIEVLPLKRSKVFETIFDQEKSIAQIMASDSLARHTYKSVSDQFDAIYHFIDSLQHHANIQEEELTGLSETERAKSVESRDGSNTKTDSARAATEPAE